MTRYFLQGMAVDAVQYVGQEVPPGIINHGTEPTVVDVAGVSALLLPGEMVLPTPKPETLVAKYAIAKPGMWIVLPQHGIAHVLPDELFRKLYVAEREINGDTSDGYHTFNELYDHRHVLFAMILKQHAGAGFRTLRSAEGTAMPGWFIAGLATPFGQVSYHYPLTWWKRLDFLRWPLNRQRPGVAPSPGRIRR